MSARGSVRLDDLVAEIARRERRLDSKLESEGAEFLVLGLLLVEGIEATKAYTRRPGYDLLAFNPEANLCCRIQVKSRWATDYDNSFSIKNFDRDFVVHVALNRGYRQSKRIRLGGGRQPPQIYVFPVNVVRAAQNPKSKWGKVRLASIPGVEQYVENWTLVRQFLHLAEANLRSIRQRSVRPARPGGTLSLGASRRGDLLPRCPPLRSRRRDWGLQVALSEEG